MTKSKEFKIIKYEDGGISIDVRYDKDSNTIWLTQSEIAQVFNTTKRNIGMHIKNVLGGKSDFLPCVIKLSVNNQKTNAYNLDVIEAISQRSKSTSGYDFIKWANKLISNNMHTELSEISLDEDIKSKIYVIRGMQVMLDFELAELYGYDTKTFNQQVQRNINKFPKDFMFQLESEELDLILRSQNVTSSWGGRRSIPYAFTEQGIYMLMTVLKGELATKQSILIIRTFKAMKDYIIETMNSLLIYPIKT